MGGSGFPGGRAWRHLPRRVLVVVLVGGACVAGARRQRDETRSSSDVELAAECLGDDVTDGVLQKRLNQARKLRYPEERGAQL